MDRSFRVVILAVSLVVLFSGLALTRTLAFPERGQTASVMAVDERLPEAALSNEEEHVTQEPEPPPAAEQDRTEPVWTQLETYKVQSGDTLWLLAQRVEMTVDQIRELNRLRTDALEPGQTLLLQGPIAAASPAPAPATVPAAAARGALRTVSGYTVVTGSNDTASLDSVRANGSRLTDIATVSHRLRTDGSLAGNVQPRTLESGQSQGLQSWLVIQNLDESGNFSRRIADTFLQDPQARQRFAQEALVQLKRHGFTGLEIDLEDISPACRGDLTLLLEEVKALLAPQGFQLGIAVPAKTADDPHNGWSGAFDYLAIGRAADRVTIMAYDQHWFGGPSGPVASLPWVTRVVRYATGVIPPEKLLLGLPAYGYDWPVAGGTGRSVNMRRTEQLAQAHGAHWDPDASTPFIRYQDPSGVSRIVWYDNERSLKLKADLALAYGLRGVAIWRLGMESDALWRALPTVR